MTPRRTLTIVAGSLGGLVLLSGALVGGLRLAHAGEVLPGVVVEGVDIGGRTPDDAAAALADLAAARATDPVTFTFEGLEHVVTPEDAGYTVDVEGTVATAEGLGRGEGFLRTSWNHVTALWQEREAELVTTIDDDALRARVVAIAAQVDREVTPGAVSVDPGTLEVTTTPPSDGVVVDVDATVEQARDGLRTAGTEELELPVEVTPTQVTAEAVEVVAEQARAAVAEPLVVRASGAAVTLSPRDLAPLVALEETSPGTVELVVPVGVVADTFAPFEERFRVAPRSATFDAPRTPSTTLDAKADVTWRPRPASVSIVPSRDGAEFDPELTAAQLTEVLRVAQREVELRLAVVEPDLTTAQAEELGIDTLLSTFTTYHPCCANRVRNIQRLADLVDETLVLPGEQFSINQISGERTCGKGFVEDGMILRGEIVSVCGGGVSQFGTTTVNAVFFAGLKPDTYKPHSFYISRYPMGREATLNFPSPDIDVRFTNDTGHGILVRTSYTGTSITVSFYGHSDVAAVTATHGSVRNVKPYPTERRVDRSLPAGASRVKQSGRDGFSITVTRTITRADGSTATDDWSNTYVPEREIIEFNPDKPAPRPAPSSPPPSSEPAEPAAGDGGDG